MKWRFLKLDWEYAIGELIIVTAGVLIALAVNSWNEGHKEYMAESDTLDRLVESIQQDTTLYQTWIDLTYEKERSLALVGEVLGTPNNPLADTLGFLNDIVVGSIFGWAQPEPDRTLFDELVATGNLSLISDSEIRQSVVYYYREILGAYDRIEPRQTRYPQITYMLIPRISVNQGSNSEYQVDPGLNQDQIDDIVSAIRESDLSDYVIAEINFSRFLRTIFTYLNENSVNTLSALEYYSAFR